MRNTRYRLSCLAFFWLNSPGLLSRERAKGERATQPFVSFFFSFHLHLSDTERESCRRDSVSSLKRSQDRTFEVVTQAKGIYESTESESRIARAAASLVAGSTEALSNLLHLEILAHRLDTTVFASTVKACCFHKAFIALGKASILSRCRIDIGCILA